MSRRRVLFISQYFFPEVFKGNEIVEELVKRGYEIDVLTGKPNYPKGEFFQGFSMFGSDNSKTFGANIIRLPILPRKSGSSIMLAFNYLSFVISSFIWVHFFSKNKYDLIFVQQLSPITMALPAVWLKEKYDIPVLLWVLDLWPDSFTANSNVKNKSIVNFIDSIVKKIYQSSDKILISSKNFRKSIIGYKNISDEDIVYFPNWAESVYESGYREKQKLPNLPKGFNIMFAGNVGESQGLDVILDVSEKLGSAPINWIIVGKGRKYKWIKNEIDKRNLKNIYMLGRYPLECMPTLFSKADAMLVSLKDEEVFANTVPAKVQAYMASSKMILCIASGETFKLIEESNCGFAVEPKDVDGIVNNCLRMLELEADQRREFEKRSYNYYQNNFSKNIAIDKLEDLINEVDEHE